MSQHCGIFPIVPIASSPRPPVWNEIYPLVKSTVHYTVADVCVHACVTQTYVSNSSNAQSVIYVFPLPSDAAVCAFTAVIDDKRTIKGNVKQKDEAKREYQTAVAEGKTAGLLNQHTASIFQVSLGNLQPKQKVAVSIEYVSIVSHDGKLDNLRLTLPLSIAPKYGAPPPSLTAFQSTCRSIRGSSSAFELSMAFNMTSPISSITSTSHPISLSLGTLSPSEEGSYDPAKAHVGFSTDDMLDKDVVIVLKAQKLDHPRCVVERRTVDSSVSDALSLSLVPRFNLPPLPEQEYIFLIDRSGSMQGGRISAVRTALQIMLRSLPSKGTRFNLVSFGSRCDSLWPQSVEYSSDSVEAATKHVDAMSADYGGTEIRKALSLAFDSRPREQRNKPTMVLLLTDGESWDLEGVLKVTQDAVEESKGGLRVFVLGVGNQVSTNMCDSIARVGRGVAAYVGEQEKPEAKLMNMLKAARGGAVTDISIDWGVAPEPAPLSEDFELIDDSESPVNIAPTPVSEPTKVIQLFDPEPTELKEETKLGPQDVTVALPPVSRIQESDLSKVGPLYPGFRTSVFAIVQQQNASAALSTKVTIKGKVMGNDVALEVPVVSAQPIAVSASATNFVHALAARAFIQTLEDEKNTSAVTKAKIVRLGTTYGLASSQTSFVAIDEKGEEQKLPAPEETEDSDDCDASAPTRRFTTTRGMKKRSMAMGAPPPPGASAHVASRRAPPPAATQTNLFRFRQSALPLQLSDQAIPSPSVATTEVNQEHKRGGFMLFSSRQSSQNSSSQAMAALPVQSLAGPAASLRSAPRPRAVSPPLGPHTVESLARAQEFDGSFASSAAFFSRLESPNVQGSLPASLAGLAGITEADKAKLWATVAALAYLQKKFATDEDSWSMLAEKAGDFVSAELAGAGVGEQDKIDILVKEWIQSAKNVLL